MPSKAAMNVFSTAPPCMSELESVISTAELSRRPAHPPNHAEENRALIALARELGDFARQYVTENLLKPPWSCATHTRPELAF